MRILITNDDGITAEGLKAAEAIAAALEPEEIWVVAPAFEQSGVGHAISYINPMHIEKLAERRYAVDGTPADCVLAALYDALDARPDLVISGVNRGNNAGENVVYSGTIGGAMEGALQGIPSIAFSQYFGPGNASLDDPFDAARIHGAQVARRILSIPKAEGSYPIFWNVNFPALPARDVRGIALSPQGRRSGNFHAVGHDAPNRRRYLWISGSDQSVSAAQGSDIQNCLDGFISVTPLRADLTAHDMMDAFADSFR